MCIRDRTNTDRPRKYWSDLKAKLKKEGSELSEKIGQLKICLLYTSDAADERSSVDLGGRRIIKKKKKNRTQRQETHKPQSK